jgi:hypothetical protein
MNYYSIHGLTLEKPNIGLLSLEDQKEVSNILFHGHTGRLKTLKDMSHVKSIKLVLLKKYKIFKLNDQSRLKQIIIQIFMNLAIYFLIKLLKYSKLFNI